MFTNIKLEYCLQFSPVFSCWANGTVTLEAPDWTCCKGAVTERFVRDCTSAAIGLRAALGSG